MTKHLYSLIYLVLRRKLAPHYVSLILFILVAVDASAQITGVVYRDFNANGTRDYNAQTPAVGEVGVGGVTVTVYTQTGVVAGTATTSSLSATQGQYSITPSTSLSGPYRVMFTNLPAGYYEGPEGSQSGTTVQFTSSTTATLSLGINYPDDYCQANPPFVTPCYVNGNPQGGGTAAPEVVLVSLPYSSTGNSPSKTPVAVNSQLGTVFGVGYQRNTQYLFSGAFVKRHSGLTANGTGAIFISKPVAGSSTFNHSLFVNLDALGFDTGTDPHTNLPASLTVANYDVGAFDAVGKVGLGDLEISDDGRQLYVVNLFDRKLYRININNPADVSPTASDVTSYTLPAVSQRTGSVFRPFALKYYRDRVYVGGVTTNESVPTSTTINFGSGSTSGNLITRDTTQMKAVVFEFNPANEQFTQVLTFPLTYKKGATNNDKVGVDRAEYWLPWTNIQPATGQVPSRMARNDLPNASYPQPWLTGIEFDINGNMVLSIRDRFGDQYGNNNYGTNTSSTQLFRAISPGDILLAGKCSPTLNQWTLERNARICTGQPTAGAGGGQGPGGGEYFFSDAISPGDANGPYHLEMSAGGLALLPGTDEVASIVIDPTTEIDAGGIRRFRVSTGNSGINVSTQIFRSGNVATFGKANGLGDLEIGCGSAPIEIGNRIWNDGTVASSNGTQDNGTSPLANITIQLYRNGALLATTTSDATGEFSFSRRSRLTTGSWVGTGADTTLLPNTAYELRVPLSQTGLSASNYVPVRPNAAGTDDLIDSDGLVSGNNAVITLTTGDYGENDHSFDFGFATCPTITNPSGSISVCSGAPAPALTVTTTASGTASIRFVAFTSPQSGTAMYAGGVTLGTATPTNGTASISNVPYPANTGSVPVTYYVYAVLNPTPDEDGCRPAQLIQVTIRPVPTASATDGVITCAGAATVAGSSSLNGSTYNWRGPNSFTASTQSFTTSTVGTYTLIVSAGGCSNVNTATAVVTQAFPSVTLVQGSCNTNGTNVTGADDYYLITVRATTPGSGTSNLFEVALNANTDGTGGTVLNTGGTAYGQTVTLGTTTTFRANGSSTYALTVRDINNKTCATRQTTTAVAACSSCEPNLCPKVSVSRR